ncbi:hypothetical protein E2C01_015247 [Portunus trituberculatus]|uniref:Uncharacterized protein n=1 Tax=Portunus trituberculatus TaxID=210409 RepID=A0A5B7DM84_PORTR|nr:hypothetical protein [Portunus trituberculatus]
MSKSKSRASRPAAAAAAGVCWASHSPLQAVLARGRRYNEAEKSSWSPESCWKRPCFSFRWLLRLSGRENSLPHRGQGKRLGRPSWYR